MDWLIERHCVWYCRECVLEQGYTAPMLLSQLNPMITNGFLGLMSGRMYNGNIPGSAMNMGERELGHIMTLWNGARLERWMPPPTAVRVTRGGCNWLSCSAVTVE